MQLHARCLEGWCGTLKVGKLGSCALLHLPSPPRPSAPLHPPLMLTHPHLQVGTLRFDLNAVADTLPKAAKKEAQAAKNEFLAAVEALDLQLRKKNGVSLLACCNAWVRRWAQVAGYWAHGAEQLVQQACCPPAWWHQRISGLHMRRPSRRPSRLALPPSPSTPQDKAAAALADTKAKLDAVIAKLA